MGHKIIAVIDTNLFISGLFGKNNTTSLLQELWVTQAVQLGTSREIIKEVTRVLQYPKIKERLPVNDDAIKRLFKLICRKAIITKDTYSTDKITDDPTDNKFLACGLEVKADYVISGDNHLLSLKHFHGIQIVDAASFIRKITER